MLIICTKCGYKTIPIMKEADGCYLRVNNGKWVKGCKDSKKASRIVKLAIVRLMNSNKD